MENNKNTDEIVERWEKLGLLSNFKNDNQRKINASELYEKMAKYLLGKEGHIKNEFDNAAFAIICRVIIVDGHWEGPFIPSEIEEAYNNFYESRELSLDNTFDACIKTANKYIKNNKEKKPKHGGIPSIR